MPKGYEIDNKSMYEIKKRKKQVLLHQFNLEMIVWSLKNELVTKMNLTYYKVLND